MQAESSFCERVLNIVNRTRLLSQIYYLPRRMRGSRRKLFKLRTTLKIFALCKFSRAFNGGSYFNV